jgi:uracil-DNA glycosylase
MDNQDPEWSAARPFVPATRDIVEMRRAAAACKGCPLYRDATQTVFGQGAVPAGIMLIGEQPGDQEDRQGLPFVGPAGDVLARALEAAGIARDAVYVTNVVKHFKWEPRGKRRIHKTPRLSEIKACMPWTDAEIEAVGPRVIVCLGATAARALLGSAFRITRSRGEVFPRPGAAAIVATWHPSAVLRAHDDPAQARQLFEQLTDDLRSAARYAGDATNAKKGHRSR